MRLRAYPDKTALSYAAAAQAGELIRAAIAAHKRARILVAADAAQGEFLAALTREDGIAWGAVEMFHLGEYVGLPIAHPASSRRFLCERFIDRVRPGRCHLLHGEHDPERVCLEEGAELAAAPIDVAFAGIGENGHLAFNDPPADFQTERPYLIVRLDEASRRRQVGEGGFASVAEVPERAISISVRQLLKARAILALAPEARQAEAVRRCVEGPISPLAPASILRTHPDATLYLDAASSALLRDRPEDGNPPALQ